MTMKFWKYALYFHEAVGARDLGQKMMLGHIQRQQQASNTAY